jgi:uncharacterized membrane protein HdeD (DUF308 family)
VDRSRRTTTIILSALAAVLGLAMIVSTIARGGGPAAVGVLLGLAFIVVGCARVYLALGPRSQRDRP